MDKLHTSPNFQSDCPLCRLVQYREIKTRLVLENNLFIVVDCLICQTPMLVLKSHRQAFNDREKAIIRQLLGEIADSISEAVIPTHFAHLHQGAPLWVIDWEQRRIPDHAHCHLRPFPFPNTDNWEKVQI